MLKAASRFGLFVVAVALVFVPTLVRARQTVEGRDATRLSIKHSWIGVAPPSKASVTLRPVVALPMTAVDPEPPRIVRHAPIAAPPALHPVLAQSLDPLRGPPPARLS